MRRAVLAVAAALLVAGPTALAFFSGGYFTQPRLIAAIVAWLLVLALTSSGAEPLPRTVAGRLAVGGLALLTAWTAVSIAWAPQGGPAVESAQRLALYLGALIAAVGVLRADWARRAVEPALAGGATLVIGYGMAGRLLPGILDLARSQSADGRLEQPITYWNAEGALAAVGLILCARLVGDTTRPRAMRAAAAAAAPLLGAGVYLSYSRGAIAVALLGLAILVAAAGSRDQLWASAVALISGASAAAGAAAFPGVAALEGSHPERDGAAVLLLVSVITAASAFVALRAASRRRHDDALPWARRFAPAAALVVAVAVGLVVAGLSERPSAQELAAGAGAGRLTTTSSNRYEYWRVGLDAAEQHPLRGLGAGGFRVFWSRERSISEPVRDAHSLEIEIIAELGLVGLAAFLLMVGGVVAASARALRHASGAAAGPMAAALAWFLHASIDWDWQLPAVTLPAIVVAGALIVLAERSFSRGAG